MGAGYDIGLSFSGSSSAAASLNSPFNLTGGGGSGAPSFATATNNKNLWPYLIMAAAVVVLGLVLLFKKK